MEQPADRSARIHEISKLLQAKDLCDVERYFTEKGCPEFDYDAELDVFRFTEDGRFAFCREFADWTLGARIPGLLTSRIVVGVSGHIVGRGGM